MKILNDNMVTREQLENLAGQFKNELRCMKRTQNILVAAVLVLSLFSAYILVIHPN